MSYKRNGIVKELEVEEVGEPLQQRDWNVEDTRKLNAAVKKWGVETIPRDFRISKRLKRLQLRNAAVATRENCPEGVKHGAFD